MESRKASSGDREEGFNLKTASSDHRRFIAQQRSGEVQFHRQIATLSGGDELSMTAGYRRCLDFDPKDIEGQDFCGYWLEDGWLVAVVADGVSQSFMGHLAADECGRGLLEILWQRHGQDTPIEALLDGLHARQPQLAERVARWEISPGVPEMVRIELEKKRGTTGSQTVFAALSMDLRAGRGEVFILGDVTATVATAGGLPTELAADAKGRWSSARGKRGELARHELRDIVSVMLHSDGTGNDWGSDPLAVEVEENFAGLAQEMAGRDDLSFVAMRIQPKDRAERGVEPKSELLRGFRSPAAGAETPSSVEAARSQTVPQTFVPGTSQEAGDRPGLGAETRAPQSGNVPASSMAARDRTDLPGHGALRPDASSSGRTGRALLLGCMAGFVLCSVVVGVVLVAVHLNGDSSEDAGGVKPAQSESAGNQNGGHSKAGRPVGLDSLNVDHSSPSTSRTADAASRPDAIESSDGIAAPLRTFDEPDPHHRSTNEAVPERPSAPMDAPESTDVAR